jgi:hypothetical protein
MRAIAVILFMIYAGIALSSVVSNAYVDWGSREAAFGNMAWAVLGLSIVTATAILYFYIRTTGNYFRRQSSGNQVGLFILFFLITALLNAGVISRANEWLGDDKPFVLEGEIIDKFRDISGKGAAKLKLIVKDERGRIYELRLKRRAFDMVPGRGNHFKKEFRVGYFGIIYRKDP